ncbi:MAG: YdcF family protein, partial [Candidatus Melainabacteria bacterium]|nr:YdcF family protein [Candidatus Melainabacteria bacterium]
MTTKLHRFRIAVVLGSGLEADGSATPVTEMRAKTAADLLATKGRMKIICSGSRSLTDKGEHGQTEAQVMFDIIAAQGISPQRILLEDQSFDTLGNAIFTVDRYLKDKKGGTLYVVT